MKKKRKMLCPECGEGGLTSRLAVLTGSRKGESFPIRMKALCCDTCDFKTVAREDAAQFALRTSNAFRQAHGLLTSMDIKDLRCRLKMSQVQFARFLHVGVASVKRWELGEIQDAAMNRLILLAVEEELRKRQYGPWGGFEQLEDRMGLQLFSPPDRQPVGLAGLPNGPPRLIGPIDL